MVNHNRNETEHDSLRCLLCDALDHEVIGTRGRAGESLRVVVCRNCGLSFQSPRPDRSALQRYYEQEYRRSYKKTATPRLRHVYRAGQRAIERWRQLCSHLPSPCHLVDVGAGGGEFVCLMQQLGHEAWGIEPDISYAEFASSEYDVRISTETYENFDAPETVNVVTANHVLEHLPDPRHFLKSIHNWLPDSGLIQLEVPCLTSPIHAPRTRWHVAHLFYFTPATLSALVELCGFELVQLNTAPQTAHIQLIARKKQFAGCPPPLTGDVQQLQRLLREATLRYYLSAQPIRRPMNAAMRTLIEELAIWNQTSARHVLERLYRNL